jgi:hypothetical protein
MTMSKITKKKAAPRGRAKPAGKKQKPAKDRKRDSEDIERAVYDGMQDLRAGKE